VYKPYWELGSEATAVGLDRTQFADYTTCFAETSQTRTEDSRKTTVQVHINDALDLLAASVVKLASHDPAVGTGRTYKCIGAEPNHVQCCGQHTM